MMSGVGDTSGVDAVRCCCFGACRTLVEPRVCVQRTGDQSDAPRAQARAPAHGREIARRARAFSTRLCRGHAAVPWACRHPRQRVTLASSTPGHRLLPYRFTGRYEKHEPLLPCRCTGRIR